MRRVTGIGGVFFKARDPERLRAWYREHLGLDVQAWGGAIFRSNAEEPGGKDTVTTWSLFADDTSYFAPSGAAFMINYRVADLDGVLAALRDEGCDVDPKTERSEYGKFGWVMDPEGNRVELWEPPFSEVES
jgi:catechol 2,3-dioxygenase-like lactoylglutathione lyase family enzyme